MIVYLARDIPQFVMYCVNGKPRSSLFIESTDSMIVCVRRVQYNAVLCHVSLVRVMLCPYSSTLTFDTRVPHFCVGPLLAITISWVSLPMYAPCTREGSVFECFLVGGAIEF